MMGSGKTTVGRILSEALGYSFTDRLVISLSMYVFMEKKRLGTWFPDHLVDHETAQRTNSYCLVGFTVLLL